MTPNQRDEMIVRIDQRTADMHVALFGDGSAGSSLRERVATLEERAESEDRAEERKGRLELLKALAIPLASAMAGYFGVHLDPASLKG